MFKFIDDYFNISKMIKSKREYKERMSRVYALPEDYQYVYKKIQTHMWQFSAGAGYDIMEVHNELIDLFESGAASGKGVLEITGDDVAAFCEELLRNVKTYTEDWRIKLNEDIHKKILKKSVS